VSIFGTDIQCSTYLCGCYSDPTSESETDGKPTSTTIGVLQVWQQHGGTWQLLARQGFRTQAT
jgi:hypothetical protein